ncbi:hypothetical protein OROMI_009095 [Orobanche minor]
MHKFMTAYPCIVSGKRPIMQYDNTSDSFDSDSDVRVVRKKRKKTTKDADYPEADMKRKTIQNRKTSLKRLLPTNYFGKLQIKKGITYYRNNLRIATSSIHELNFSAAHLKAMRRIPSWYMFEAIYKHGGERMMSRCDKSDDVIRTILLSYDQDTDHFIIRGKEVQLTGLYVALIFGIICGTKKIPFKKPNSRNSKWVKHNFGKDTESSLNKTLIFN